MLCKVSYIISGNTDKRNVKDFFYIFQNEHLRNNAVKGKQLLLIVKIRLISKINNFTVNAIV